MNSQRLERASHGLFWLTLLFGILAGGIIPWKQGEEVATRQRVPALPAIDRESEQRHSSTTHQAIGESRSRASLLNCVQPLPESERHSLLQAVRAARLAIQPLNAHESSLQRNQGVKYFASNPSQRLSVRFLDGAARIEPQSGAGWYLSLEHSAASTSPESDGRRVDYFHPDGMAEWYLNTADGIEHGFTLEARPEPLLAGGSLRVEVGMKGLSPKMIADTQGSPCRALELIEPAHAQPVLHYKDLKAFDATGRELAAEFQVRDNRVSILVAANDAQFPVTIDPLITSLESVLELDPEGDAAPGYLLGTSAAIVGNTVLLGAPGDDTAAGEGAGSVFVFVGNEGAWGLQQKLKAADGSAGDGFGFSLAMSGDVAIIGARLDDTEGGADAGSAYVFTRDGAPWIQRQKLTASSGAVNAQFGCAVAISSETILVGASQEGPGAAYIFADDGVDWTEQARLVAGDGAAGDFFGISVAISGATALIGAYWDDTSSGSDAGSAYVFIKSGVSWVEQAKLTANDGAVGDRFGKSVALATDTALVGAFNDDTSRVDAGTVYVFSRSGTTWSQQQKLTATDPVASYTFGSSLALYGETVLIGAPQSAQFGGSYGRAYVFAKTGTVWSQQAVLAPASGSFNDLIGFSVALSEATAIVGAPTDDTDAGSDAGSAYVFVGSGAGWSFQQSLTAGRGSSEQLGEAVSLWGDTAVIGSPRDSTAAGSSAGSAYVFACSEGIWSLQATLIPGDSAPGEQFGCSVAAEGNTVVIGSWLDDTELAANTGSAYVFVRDAGVWSQQAKLLADDGASNAAFGRQLSLSGNTVLVGAPTVLGMDAGSAYIFVRDGTSWAQEAKLTADDGAPGDNFGFSVALWKDTALVGAQGDDIGSAVNAGSAYVSVRSGTHWTQQHKLTAADGAANDNFGAAVALWNGTALIGAPGDDFGSVTNAGSAYVFVNSGAEWSEQAKLIASDAGDGDAFGSRMALFADIALISAYLDDTFAGVNAGSAYIFARQGNWTQATKLEAADADAGDSFGIAVALTLDRALIGSSKHDTFHKTSGEPFVDAGGAYMYALRWAPAVLPPLSSQFLGDGTMMFSLPGTSGQSFVLERTSCLSPAHWIPRSTNLPTDGEVVFIDIPDATTNNFWRVKLSPGSN